MSLHDFRCPSCGTLRPDIHVPCDLGASRAEVYCLACEADLDRQIRCEPIPAIRLSVFSDADTRSSPRDFAKTTTQVEDPGSPSGYREVTVGSLADIRRVERESEQRERNGEGRRMVWRDYSQDRSNQQVHTFAPDPSLKPSKTFVNGQPVMSRRGSAVIADHGDAQE